MRRGKRLLCGALALVLGLSLLAAATVQRAYATKTDEEKKSEEQAQRQAEMDELEKKKQEKRERVAELQKQIAEAKAKKEDVMGTKTLLDQRNQLLMEEIDDTKAQIDLYAQQITEYEEMESEQYDLFCQQVRSEEERGSLSYWSVLFKATSIADLLNRLEFVNEVAEYDRNLIEAIRQTRENIKAEKTAMEEQEQLLAQQQDALQQKVDEAAALIAEYAATQKGYEELAAADVVLLSTGTIDVESFERPFALPKEEEAFIRTAVESNPNTIVLVNSGSGIRMGGWNDKAAAVIYGWYPGQSGFTALADILSGKLSPSGKLPMTIEKEFNDSPAKGTMPAGAEFYNKAPRAYNERLIQLYDIDYKESVLVGYRWYETKGIAPLYPFGFGLSYTTFELSKPRAPKAFPADKPLKVSVTLTNTGDREGAEVVQLYVTENAPTVLRPKKELKGFRKVTLAPGKSAVVEFELDRQALAFWDTQSRGWKVNPGEYTLSLGTSSADIAATLPVSVK